MRKKALGGAAWSLSPGRAVIQLNARHGPDDHLWFSFFHGAAHIVFHSKKGVFVDQPDGNNAEQEIDANEWASNFPVPKTAWEEFVATLPRSERVVRVYAEEQGIGPGIVVGMLQHKGLLAWTHLNALEVRLDWQPELTLSAKR